MEPTPEIRRLMDVMPASGRMHTKIVSKSEQPWVIAAPFPLPWKPERTVLINFDLWRRLPRPQRDLVILRTVSWLGAIRWFQPGLFQGLAVVGLMGGVAEALQGDALGLVMATGLTTIAGLQIWRSSRSCALELEADAVALRVAQRRSYTEAEAAAHLLAEIAAVAQIEGRSALNFTELIRCQNLRAIAGLSPVEVPETIRRE
ncbi:hypothetical protein DO97_01835 [Neosynechococcus sphagnicola sy1]|uniref:DUF3318 domain-containing protein n=1 Tax=Neosynechococcus sphagnicola sy1 TaxID=1497020 RepID=A0A098TLC1_9CYAN|nr:DUF3318 domain-containing protein [Neosynechococcus sphagnicola]KGF73105.1 hypothetical protein DO97_01835 [Neosynechococcus sphagnicola sy1]